MGKSITHKILAAHVEGALPEAGTEIALRIDQTLTQDSTGTMAYLQFEAMGIPRVNTKRSLAYVDHNMLQAGFENADDHKYLQTVTKKHGVYFSRPGNGVCHQVELERFAVPGQTLIGSDSHTPTAGGLGMLAIGAGGLDVAVAMGGGRYYISMPKVVNVILEGELSPYVSAKDIILEVLRRLTVSGGVGKVMEYTGSALEHLSVPERATIANLGAELGATSSIFPSDEVAHSFLKAQGREGDWVSLLPDEDAPYDETLTIDVSKLEPLTACPHSPGNVKNVSELEGMRIDQVAIGSCTNSSYMDMMKVAAILKGKTIAENVSLVIAPGSKQVLGMLADNGALSDMIAAGARILESGCGPCIGMGQAPATNAVSLRTFNRNFFARSGTASAQVYLVSPETAAASALAGVFTDPRGLGGSLNIEMPGSFKVNDNGIISPASEEEAASVEVVRGPNIAPFPVNTALPGTLKGSVLLVMEDDITTDDIMPSNASLLPFRSNIPHLSDYCLSPVDKTFAGRAKETGGGLLVAGNNYGQGSSREHASLVPLYLGIKGVIAKSFARIHAANLINSGILPLVFENPSDWDGVSRDDELVIENLRDTLKAGGALLVKNRTKGTEFRVLAPYSERLRDILLSGGLLNHTKEARNDG